MKPLKVVLSEVVSNGLWYSFGPYVTAETRLSLVKVRSEPQRDVTCSGKVLSHNE